MCGICGKIANHVDKKKLEEMTDALYTRGPDAKGTYIASVGGREVGFGHRRLSIFDTSEGANQPFVSDDGKYVVIYNGEIYNFKELKEQLKGHFFHTSCDTEVLLHAFMEWGINSISKFNGMFAFAILDKERGIITICRDRLGVKPLYYSFQNNQFFFSPDLAALMKDETFDKALDEEAIHYYLWNMCVPSPYSIFKRTKKLEAGEYLELNISDFSYEKRKWWDINTEYYIGEQSDKWVDKVEKDLIDAVKIRLEADVPVGIFLSGGIDSSLVAAIASRLKKGDVDTFSIGFNEKEFDEACYAEDIAKHLGTRHYSLYCSISEAKELISEIPKAYSEPFADNSQIPMMLLSKLTKDYVTVSLSGDGGDEFFWGYPNVIDAAKLFNNRAVSRMFHSFTLPYSRFLKKSIFSHKTWKIKKLCNATSARNIGNLDYVTAYDLIESILSSDYGKEKKTFWDNGIIGNLGKMFDCCHSESDFIKVYMLRDIVVGLEGDMLAKVDRATMYYSIEARCPLLDCHVIEDSFKIPLDVKYRNNTLKYVLKNILYRYIPRELVDRPKHGFGIPINKWLHEKEFMNGFEKYFASEYLEEQGIFSIEGILKFKAAFDRNAGPMVDRVMWTYIVFQMWWEEYMA